jgi:hypothetical protein
VVVAGVLHNQEKKKRKKKKTQLVLMILCTRCVGTAKRFEKEKIGSLYQQVEPVHQHHGNRGAATTYRP